MVRDSNHVGRKLDRHCSFALTLSQPVLALHVRCTIWARTPCDLLTYSHQFGDDIDAASRRFISSQLGVAELEISAGPSRVPSDVQQSSGAGRPLSPFKRKARPASLAVSSCHTLDPPTS
jgi:hypothetical protein